MKNFPIIDKETGREYWVSRSMAVVVFVFAKDNDGDECILAVKRGKGTPDPEYVGKYCVPCGYLDYDETLQQAAARELKEETGLTFPNCDFKLFSINDNPYDDKRQNVTFRFVVNCLTLANNLELLFTTKNSEKDEVDFIRFIKIKNINLYEWAFNHEELIKKVSNQRNKTTTL